MKGRGGGKPLDTQFGLNSWSVGQGFGCPSDTQFGLNSSSVGQGFGCPTDQDFLTKMWLSKQSKVLIKPSIRDLLITQMEVTSWPKKRALKPPQKGHLEEPGKSAVACFYLIRGDVKPPRRTTHHLEFMGSNKTWGTQKQRWTFE